MKDSAKLRKAVFLLNLALLVALGIIFKLPQQALRYAESIFFEPSVVAVSPQSQDFTQQIKPQPPKPRVIPADSMPNVKTDYGAKGDGVTDDTEAIKQALVAGREPGGDFYLKPKAIYFPAGTYLVSDTLEWEGCCLSLQGQGRGITTIKLQDKAAGYDDSKTPKAVIKTPEGTMSFRQNIWDLSVDTGSDNPGAIGIDYIANNSGALQNVSIKSGDGKGQAGVSMARYAPGPSLTKNVQIDGFDYGILVGQPEYGPTFEDITLKNQNVAGVANYGNEIVIRKLESINTVPAIQNHNDTGSVIVLDGNFQGGGSSVSAIENKSGVLYARNIVTQGYKSAISNKDTVIPGESQSEYFSEAARSLFDNPQRSLLLPVEETPAIDDDIADWQKFQPRWYGDTELLQSVLNSGKSTIYFPQGTYQFLRKTVVKVPATVKRIVGFTSVIDSEDRGSGIVFRVEENSTQPLIIEQFGIGVAIEHDSPRTVVLKHGGYIYSESTKAGKLFLEDVEIGTLNINHPQKVWARQLNVEGVDATGNKIKNKGGILWILGLKTENKGTVINTSAGGKTELLGTLIYPSGEFSAEEKQQAAFINNDSSQSLIYTRSVYGENRYYDIQVKETHNGVSRELLSQDTPGRSLSFIGYKK